jgi:hypothetical protein
LARRKERLLILLDMSRLLVEGDQGGATNDEPRTNAKQGQAR